MENVFSMVAPNPRYKPRMPSCLYICDITANIESSSLPFPLLLAWIRVLTLLRYTVRRSDSMNRKRHTHLMDIQPCPSFNIIYHKWLDNVTDAVLKQPPNAPANAAPKGVSCWTGFDWVGIGLWVGWKKSLHFEQTIGWYLGPERTVRRHVKFESLGINRCKQAGS